MSDKETKLEITKEAVLRAAGKCGTAKEVLKEMFPEAFGVNGEWEDVTDKAYVGECLGDLHIFAPRPDKTRDFIQINEDGTWANDSSKMLKVEGGKLWMKAKKE